MTGLAPGIRVFGRLLRPLSSKSGRVHVFIFTFIIYVGYHISRKPISVVKPALHSNCTEKSERSGKFFFVNNETFCDWKPFDGPNYDTLFGTLDVVYLSAYAISMFISGHVADKLDLRIYLTFGSILAGLSTVAFGLGYFFDIHSFAFYVIVQFIGGIFQATGWPAVVACMGNWFGKGQRGLFMGIWNAHTSLGNILGSLIAGVFVEIAWGWSFVVPGLILAIFGIFTYFFLIPYPELVGVRSPQCVVYEPTEVQSSSYLEQSSSSDEFANLTSSNSELINSVEQDKAVSFWTALRIPGVIEYSLCLFFAKLVSYTFLFWLPSYIREAGGFNPSVSADLSVVFDLGGIVGGILAGFILDRTGASATICLVMLVCSVPSLYLYYAFGFKSITTCIGLLVPLGLFVNGPYALITTAVSADLGTHSSLRSNSRALATVTGIIDGTGSVGAALGPLLCGLLKPYGWIVVIAMLMTALALASMLLIRRVMFETQLCCDRSPHTPNTDSTIS